jgi:predicted nuclease of predicted toxin-antitoxin system
MKYLIDANLPIGLSMWKGDNFVFVNQLNPEWSDREIWQYALNNNLIIVTKDSDFSIGC